ncbi:unnamed protein product [Plutella xylostella]|uniref:(diamondback moth) hypothetical protein n=1 Tax=Plutella xylostella TaxID=51655 RepID=A0A8S4G5W2_PLUXY|nr:unnamed protein product [Plutella xylostella]
MNVIHLLSCTALLTICSATAIPTGNKNKQTKLLFIRYPEYKPGYKYYYPTTYNIYFNTDQQNRLLNIALFQIHTWNSPQFSVLDLGSMNPLSALGQIANFNPFKPSDATTEEKGSASSSSGDGNSPKDVK